MIRRRKTGNAIFLAILLACSAGAIGFSSWIFGDSSEIKSDFSEIGVEIGDIDDFRDCIAIDEDKPNGGIQPLLFCSAGFVNSSSSSNSVPSSSTKGYLEIDLKLNQTNIKSKISTSSIYLYETLTLADTNGNTTNFTSPTVYVNYLNSDIPSTASSNSLNNEWKSQHLLDSFNDLVSDNGEIYISLKYELTPVSSVAYTRIYNYLTSSSTNAKLVLSLNLGEANA